MKTMVTITMDEELMKMAREKGINISGTFNKLLRDYLRIEKVVEEKRVEEDIVRLQEQKRIYETEREILKKQSAEELSKSEVFQELKLIHTKEMTFDDVVPYIRRMRDEGYKVGYMEVLEVLNG